MATEKVVYGSTWAKRRTIAEWAGRKKVSSADLDEIQEVLEAAGIGLYPTPLRLREPDDTVRIYCGDSPEVGLEFGSEAELRDFLLTHHKRLHPLARLDSLKPEVRVPFDDSYVVVDLVGTESRGVVVIELKLGDGYYKIGSQIRRYIEAMELEEAKRARPRRVRGVVRSEEHTSELQSLMRISYAVFCLK